MPVSALLFTTPSCPHCPGIKQALQALSEEKLLSSLEVIDATQQPERAQAMGVRNVPWLQLGELQFDGAMTLGELRH